jgi:predicted DNA repair protein MutK
MAAASLLALLDDITLVLDDVAVMTKVAAKKTAGVLGDDLALNAQQVAGIRAERELPVVWKVALGSLLNKAILVPVALVISVFAPWAILPLLMIGGLFLCFEGVEKLAHKFLHSQAEDDAHHADLAKVLADPAADMVAFERDKIKGAVRTDFILSAEIIVITLGTVATQPLATKAIVLAGISLLMTIGVYGLVAGIVKMDDAGLWLSRQAGALQRKIGAALLVAAPLLMKFLAIAGTAAMFLVGGGILVHGIGPLHHAVEGWTQAAGGLGWLVEPLVGGLAGIVAGAIVLTIFSVGKKLFARPAAAA